MAFFVKKSLFKKKIIIIIITFRSFHPQILKKKKSKTASNETSLELLL